MGTEAILIKHIENDLRLLTKKKKDIKDLQIKARLARLEKLNKYMYEDLNEQLENIINPIFKFENEIILSPKAIEFYKLFKN